MRAHRCSVSPSARRLHTPTNGGAVARYPQSSAAAHRKCPSDRRCRQCGRMSTVQATTRAERAAQSMLDPLARTLLALTFTTGIVDGVSYLGLGHVFTANMTGNVVLLGFGIAGSGGLPVVAPIVSLAAFLCGAGLGGRLAARLATRHNRHIAAALGIEVVLIGAAAIFAALVTVRAGKPSADAVIAALALAMGTRTATVR